jgi:hypothetical protein
MIQYCRRGWRERRKWCVVLQSIAGVAWTLLGFADLVPAYAAGSASPPDVVFSVAGPAQTVYNYKLDHCSQGMFPDTAARAFRNAQGDVRLLAPTDANWSLIGPSLTAVSTDCHSLGRASNSDAPAAFDDLAWIEATYTEDGKQVYALASNEFSAVRHPEDAPGSNCKNRGQQGCLYYGITEFVSGDGGKTFGYPPGQDHVVAVLPYQFKPDAKRADSVGIATVSNIILKDGYYYAYVGVRGMGAWKSGSCLIRTKTLAQVRSWRGWSGSGFDVRFVNPYVKTEQAEGPVCTPVVVQELRSVSWSAALHTYVGVVRDWGQDSQGKRVAGIFYATTPDLIHWSDFKLLMPVPLEAECGDMLFYPSILDPSSTSRNFETISSRPFLYLTRFDRTSCGGTLDRDLVRVPLHVETTH